MVRITAVEEYGLRCLLALAREGTQGQLSINDIAEQEALSVPYASKLLSLLRKARLVSSVRGRKGGFCIARSPHEITLYEVMIALGGPLIDPDHCTRFSGQLEECVHSGDCSVHHVLGSLAGYVAKYLRHTSLQDVLDGSYYDLTRSAPSEPASMAKPGAAFRVGLAKAGTDNENRKHTLNEGKGTDV